MFDLETEIRNILGMPDASKCVGNRGGYRCDRTAEFRATCRHCDARFPLCGDCVDKVEVAFLGEPVTPRCCEVTSVSLQDALLITALVKS